MFNVHVFVFIFINLWVYVLLGAAQLASLHPLPPGVNPGLFKSNLFLILYFCLFVCLWPLSWCVARCEPRPCWRASTALRLLSNWADPADWRGKVEEPWDIQNSKFKNLSTYRGKGADWGEKKAGGNFSGQQGGTYINQLHRKLLTKVQRELELCWQFMRNIARVWNHRFLMYNLRLWAVWRDTRWNLDKYFFVLEWIFAFPFVFKCLCISVCISICI